MVREILAGIGIETFVAVVLGLLERRVELRDYHCAFKNGRQGKGRDGCNSLVGSSNRMRKLALALYMLYSNT